MLYGFLRTGFLTLLCGGAVAGQIRIASLNMAKQYGPRVLAEIGAQQDLRKADVLLLQEVVDGSQSHMASEIGAAPGLSAVFEPAFQLNRQFMEGLAILSRYPVGPATVASPAHNKHFLGLNLDWIYLRGLTAAESGVTPIAFSDHNSVWVTVR